MSQWPLLALSNGWRGVAWVAVLKGLGDLDALVWYGCQGGSS